MLHRDVNRTTNGFADEDAKTTLPVIHFYAVIFTPGLANHRPSDLFIFVQKRPNRINLFFQFHTLQSLASIPLLYAEVLLHEDIFG